MHLTAIFESWHIGDGNYPPFSKGNRVNLSFEVDCAECGPSKAHTSPSFLSTEDASCQFVAQVLRHYSTPGESPIAVLDAGDFRFYVHGNSARSLAPGDWIKGSGTLALDHYLWVEFLDERSDPPNLFYNLDVRRIRKVQIPERFITRHERGKAMPTTVEPGEYSAKDVQELETMEGQNFNEAFYIIDFETQGLEQEIIARTFR